MPDRENERATKPGKEARESPDALRKKSREWNSHQANAIVQKAQRRHALAQMAMFQLRQRLGITQQQFADLLGISLRSITRYESGGDPLTPLVLTKLTQAAVEAGHKDLAHTFHRTFLEIFSLRLSAGSVSLEEHVSPDLSQQRLRELLRSFRDLWDVFQPSLNETEERIRKRLDALVKEITDFVKPEKS